MAETTLIKKLLIKADKTHLILNAPDGYLTTLTDIPAATLHTTPQSTHYDLVQLFVRSQSEFKENLPIAFSVLKPGGILWIAFPKKSGKLKTDMSRDHGWDALTAHDWHPVTLISLDETWSSMRVRPRAEIKVMTRKF